MAKTFTGPFGQTPKAIKAKVTTAHTTLEGATNTVLAYTAGTEGGIVTRLTFSPIETVTAGVAYAYRSPDGSTFHLIEAQAVAADTVSTTDAPTKVSFSPTETLPWRLEAGDRLYVAFSLTKGGTFYGDAMDY